MENLNLVLPEIFISLSIMFLLILGVFKKNSSKITFNLSLFTILITAIVILSINIIIDIAYAVLDPRIRIKSQG